MTLKVFYSNETSEIVPVKKDEVTGFNSTVPENDQILEVHKGSFTVTFKIQVLINDIQAISIKTLQLYLRLLLQVIFAHQKILVYHPIQVSLFEVVPVRKN